MLRGGDEPAQHGVLTMLRRMRARVADEGGFTLPELLIATLIGLSVVGAAAMFFTVGVRDEPKVAARANRIQEARFTMERIVRELRQGSAVSSASAGQLTFVTYVDKTTCGGVLTNTARACRVTYNCSGGICTRTEAQPDGSAPGTAVTVATGLSSNNVFTYTPATLTTPASVGVSLAFPAQNGDDAITLSDGATLRNPSSS